jgi:hypothetical protein
VRRRTLWSNRTTLHRAASALQALLVAACLFGGAMSAHAEAVGFKVAITSADSAAKPRVLRATKGDKIAIDWSADKPTVVHIHPYDIEQELKPGAASRSEFTADISGRFPIEAHAAGKKGGGKVVAYLEVLPR